MMLHQITLGACSASAARGLIIPNLLERDTPNQGTKETKGNRGMNLSLLPIGYLTLKFASARMRLPVSLAVLASCASLAMGLVVNFTGDVVADFPSGSGVFIAADATNDVFFTNGGVLNPTGWNIHDVRFAYDAVSDTAYFGTRDTGRAR